MTARRLMVVLGVLAWAGMASATVVSTEGFNTQTLGSLHTQTGGTNMSGAWSAVESGTKFMRVEDTHPSEGTQHVHIYGSSGTPTMYRNFLAGQAENVLYYRVDIQILNATITSNLGIEIGDNSSTTNADRKIHMELQPGGTINQFISSSNKPVLGRWDGTDPQGLANAGADYVKLEIYADKTAFTYNVVYQDVPIATNLPWRYSGGSYTNVLNRITFVGGMSGSNDPAVGGTYIDNIVLTPEPVSAVLLMLGAVLIRRR